MTKERTPDEIMHSPEWDEACRWAQDYCQKRFHKEWHDDSIADAYMAARNGYLAAKLLASAHESKGFIEVNMYPPPEPQK